jgi:hypothetical protein
MARIETAAVPKRAKKKSSGWRPWDKRRTTDDYNAQTKAERIVQAHRDCVELRLWRRCPARRCRRLRGCIGQPLECLEQRRPAANGAAQARRVAAPPASAAPPAAAGPVLSAREAAAAIAASIAEAMARGEIADDI